MDAHPIVALTGRLRGGFVESGADLAKEMPKITADIKMGPALHEGELVLAALLSRYLPGHRSKGWHAALAVTDRRLYGSIANGSVPPSSFDIPLSHVTDVREEGVLGGSARVVLGPHSVTIPVFGREVVQHLRAVLTLHPAARTTGPLVLAPQPGDPVGAHSAVAMLAFADARMRAIPALAYEVARRGHVHEATARGWLERLVILGRSMSMGRAMHQGRWLSTLPRAAVRSVLCASLGDPQDSSVGATWDLHDFAVDRGGMSRGAALAFTALGLASAATLGVGFVVRSSAGLGLDRLRVTLSDVPCGTSLELRAVHEGAERRLPFGATDLLQPLFASLARVELRGLLAEIAYAGRIPPEQQPAVPRAELEAAVAGLGGAVKVDDLYDARE